jgi:hypothetical protein
MQVYGINDLNALSQSYKDKVNIIMIYISEAHASDEWPISRYTCTQHKTVEERLNAANRMKQRFDCQFKIFVDSIDTDSSFESKYLGWPERGYIFYKNKLEYVSYAGVNSRMFWFNEMKEWLEKNNFTS